MSGGTHHPIPEFRDADHFWGPGLSQVVNGSHEIIRPKPRRWVQFTSSTTLTSTENEKERKGEKKNLKIFFKKRGIRAKSAHEVRTWIFTLAEAHLIIYTVLSSFFAQSQSLHCVLRNRQKEKKNETKERGKDGGGTAEENELVASGLWHFISVGSRSVFRGRDTNRIQLVQVLQHFSSSSSRLPTKLQLMYTQRSLVGYVKCARCFFLSFIPWPSQLQRLYTDNDFFSLIAVSNWGRELISSRFFFSSPVFFIFIFFYEECSSSSCSNPPPPFSPQSRYYSFSLKERISFGTCSVSNHEIFFFVFRKRARKVPRKWTPESPIFSWSKGNTLKTLGLVHYVFFSWAFLSPPKRRERIRVLFTERFSDRRKVFPGRLCILYGDHMGKRMGHGYSVNP